MYKCLVSAESDRADLEKTVTNEVSATNITSAICRTAYDAYICKTSIQNKTVGEKRQSPLLNR